MKTTILILPLIIILAFQSYSQENDSQEIKTLFSNEFTNGGYASFDIKISPVHEDLGLLTGGKGGWIINHNFVIGGAGYGLTTPSSFSGIGLEGNDTTLGLDFGYGGLLFEFIFKPTEPIHIAFPLIFGAGGCSVYENNPQKNYNDNYYHTPVENSAFVVIEPGADLQFNMIKYFRMSIGVSYRLVLASDLIQLTNQNLSGISFQLSFKYGLF